MNNVIDKESELKEINDELLENNFKIAINEIKDDIRKTQLKQCSKLIVS